MANPRPIAEIIVDRFVGHQVNVLRLTAGELERVVRMLTEIRQDIERQIIAADLSETTIVQQRRLNALWKTLDRVIHDGHARIADGQHERLVAIAKLESERTVKLTNAQVGVPLLSVGVPVTVLKTLVDDRIVQGRPAAEWWAQLGDDLRGRLQQTLRQGIFAGETMSQLLRRVRGTREHRFQDGLFKMETHKAAAIIRTSIQSVANAARHETLKANDDVLRGQQWATALDGRVCEQCIPLSGQAWDFEGNPIDETTQPFPGPPPLHWGDRCGLIPVLKSWEQLIREAKGDEKLGRKLDRIEGKIGKGTQASMDGQVAADLTYNDWLKRRSEEEQQEILGIGKWKLWEAGKITLSDLVDQTGRPLTLEELQSRIV